MDLGLSIDSFFGRTSADCGLMTPQSHGAVRRLSGEPDTSVPFPAVYDPTPLSCRGEPAVRSGRGSPAPKSQDIKRGAASDRCF